MQLTQPQKTALRAHMALNTNLTPTPGVGGSAFAVNARLATRNADDQQAIADWYNRTASAADGQPLAAPLAVWVPALPVMGGGVGPSLNSAVNWQQPFAGATPADQTVSLLTYLAMTQGLGVDMTDQGVRKGLAQVFGTAGGGATANAVGAAGQRPGTTAELLLAGVAVGPNGLGTAAARKSPVFGQLLTAADVEDVLLNG